MEIFKYIVAKHFFTDYAPGVTSWRKKLVGKNTNGNPLAFTPEDREKIDKGIEKLYADLKKQSP